MLQLRNSFRCSTFHDLLATKNLIFITLINLWLISNVVVVESGPVSLLKLNSKNCQLRSINNYTFVPDLSNRGYRSCKRVKIDIFNICQGYCGASNTYFQKQYDLQYLQLDEHKNVFVAQESHGSCCKEADFITKNATVWCKLGREDVLVPFKIHSVTACKCIPCTGVD